MTSMQGMSRRTLLAAMGAAGAVAVSGCARYYYGTAVGQGSIDLVTSSQVAVDTLLQQAPLDANAPVLVGTVVQVDRLEESSRLGRLLSEQFAGRLAQRGLRVTELRMRESLALRPGQGELMLSRQVQEVARAQAAQAVLVGTYAVAHQAVYVSLKLVGAGNTMLAAHDYALPMDANVRGLLAGGL